jgi:DNA-binding MarR family transcriptional regulator
MTTHNKQIHTNEFITRNEFSAFEKTVDANFAESKQSQAEIRHVLNNLTSKIDSMANKGLDLKTLFGGIMVIIAIMGGISSLISWGLNDKMTSQEALAKEGRTAIKESLNEKVSSIVDFVEKLEKQNSINHDRLVALVEKERHQSNRVA